MVCSWRGGCDGMQGVDVDVDVAVAHLVRAAVAAPAARREGPPPDHALLLPP